MPMSRWRADGPWNGLPPAVYPVDDLRDHEADNPQCWCHPTMSDGILVHHAMDRRVEYEEGRQPC